MKVSELTGRELDLFVAKAIGTARLSEDGEWLAEVDGCYRSVSEFGWHPSTDWSQAGPLIEEYRMYIDGGNPHDQGWSAATGPSNMAEHAHGDTPLQAICRAVVRAEFGDEVPDQL